jgi:uncharacterized membrane protein
MKLRKGEFISIGIIAVMFAAAFIVMPYMPLQMVSHWGIDGKPNGYMPRIPALFILPCMSLVMFLTFAVISRIDPKGKIKEFAVSFDSFTAIFFGLFAYVYTILILTGAGLSFDMNAVMAPFFSGLYLALAGLVENAKPNYFVGVRTPWTLENPEIWARTHERGGLVFRLCGFIAIGGLFVPRLVIFFAVVPPGIGIIYLIYYSYKLYAGTKTP